MFNFWYRFLPRNFSLINSNNAEIAYKYIAQNIDQYMGEIFEQICIEYLWKVNGTSRLPFDFIEAGRWWGANQLTKGETEIDIVAHDGIKDGLFCECKWSKSKVGKDILVKFTDISSLPQFAKLTNKHYCLFSRSGFTASCLSAAKEKGNVLLITLDDMLQLPL
jgi:AAA+ ATPase superfamily predicted ATPase